MAQVDIDNIVEYQVFRRNPGPLLGRAAQGSPLLLIKGRQRLVVVDAATYNDLVERAGLADRGPAQAAVDAAEDGEAEGEAGPGGEEGAQA
jgi:hypothetical protein